MRNTLHFCEGATAVLFCFIYVLRNCLSGRKRERLSLIWRLSFSPWNEMLPFSDGVRCMLQLARGIFRDSFFRINHNSDFANCFNASFHRRARKVRALQSYAANYRNVFWIIFFCFVATQFLHKIHNQYIETYRMSDSNRSLFTLIAADEILSGRRCVSWSGFIIRVVTVDSEDSDAS